MEVNVQEVRDAIRQRLESQDVEGAFAALFRVGLPLTEVDYRNESHRAFAHTALELFAAVPHREGAEQRVLELLERPELPIAVTIAATSVLVGIAATVPADVPDVAAPTARRAAEWCARALEALNHADRIDANVAGRLYTNQANALRLMGPDQDGAARTAFEAALGLDRNNGDIWFDLALLHKWRGRMEEALSALSMARRAGRDDRGTLWNEAICATALGDGARAAAAWQSLGMPATVNAGGMPVVEGLTPVQVRALSRGTGKGLNPVVPDREASFEVLWVAPISPCHGVVQSPTFRDAQVDYGDVVLWDGAPVGVRKTAEGVVPTFPLLALLRAGDERRLGFAALEQNRGDIRALGEALPDGCRLFVHAERVAKESGDEAEAHRILYGKIIVEKTVTAEALEHALTQHVAKDGRVQIAVPGLYEWLGDSKRAGQEHQAFRGIEQVAIRRSLTKK